MEIKSFDIIIAGAGAAGLSLLWNLMQDNGKQLNILVADVSLKPTDDKTWCFWDDSHLPAKEWISHSWSFAEVRVHGQTLRHKLTDYGYYCVRSDHYKKSILSEAEKHPSVTLLECSISGFSVSDHQGVMHTDIGDFKADWVFQSALKSPGFDDARVDNSLMQHFVGWEIRTKKEMFDPETIMMMDFDTPQIGGLTFFYILPFSSDRALIEHTLFTGSLLEEEEYDREIKAYLKREHNLGDGDYELIRREKGIIPMEDRRYPHMYNERVMNIGTMGGLTKASTGYTFTRIQKECKRLAEQLLSGKKPERSNASSYRFRVYDMMLLHILNHHSDEAVDVFKALFTKNDLETIFRFLEEDTHFGEELGIFTSVPYVPFLRSIWKMKHRIFTGA
jgi:lycopene beta-cyclase